MYLKCIRANGFKSFADKIELDINPGITGVVGPNGSGKSNIVDAVRWVLGEQSVKALRGDTSMIDVIFSGSKTRAEKTRASVSLVFDNSDHYLNSEFNEIEIKRAVYKTGENEYFINNTKVRLKDITDLFIDSGAGKESFNIISQGAVAEVVDNKPEERRTIFEEASGVLKYKKRKEESLRKLDRTNENLERVNLLIDELLITLTPLKEQSDKARKYLEYKDELENIEVALIATEITKINDEYQKVKENVKKLNEEVLDLDTSNNTDTSKIEKLKLQSLKIDNAIEEKNNLITSLTETIATLESKKQITMERQKYKVDDAKLQESILSLKEEVLNLNKLISTSTTELTDLKKDLEIKQLKNMEFTKLTEEKKNKRNILNNDINILNKEILNLNNKVEILKDNMNNDTKLPYSVKNVVNNIRLTGIYGVLGKLIKVNEKYVTAIETALGANSNVIVVENEKNAKEAINYLKENKLGRATFFPISIIKPRNVLYEDLTKVNRLEGFIGTADSLVDYDEKFRGVVLNQLGNVIVVDNIDTLNRIGKILNYKYKIVSLEGEIQYSGGAITGGILKTTSSLLSQKYELENLNKELRDKNEKLSKLDNNLFNINKEIDSLRLDLENNQRELITLNETFNLKSSHLEDLKKNYTNKNNELVGTQNKSNNTLDKELEEIVNEYYEKVSIKEDLVREVNKYKSNKADINDEIMTLEKTYRDMNSKITQKQNELKNEEIKLGKMDVKLDGLLLNLNETYNLTYEKAKESYTLDIDYDTAKITVSNLKDKLKSLGEVNTGSINEYERINERYTFLTNQKNDLENSITSLMSVISEMDEIMKSKFIETFNKIRDEFKVVFKKLFKGGEGILELTNPDDILNTGIEISAVPPGKKLKSIALLSGGEKTLTAIALLFAILNVKPVPFVILDEVEAALDEVNVDAFGNYLLSCKNRSQFVIITHKKRTMEYADALYGITMQESGVSKVVSVKLEG